MKLAVLLLIVLFGVWLWRSGRRPPSEPRAAKPQAAAPLAMVACPQCGTHVPAAEGISGERGVYCSQEHRRAAES